MFYRFSLLLQFHIDNIHNCKLKSPSEERKQVDTKTKIVNFLIIFLVHFPSSESGVMDHSKS